MSKENLLTKGKIFSWLIFALFSCKEQKTESDTIKALPVYSLIAQENSDSHLPYLFVHNGKMNISWVQSETDTSILLYGEITEVSTHSKGIIAKGNDWFVNWADYPQVEAFENGTRMATFLQKSSPATFSYDVMYSISLNGKDWSDPKVLHDDQTLTEHGFVSMSPWEKDMLITWLDGRNTSGEHQSSGHHQGAMTLRAAVIDNQGTKIHEWLLDERVCDCCQTASTSTKDGPVVVFRDRSEQEIRDIGFVSWEGEKWTSSHPVHMDLWEIAACPVNGPRIVSMDNLISVAWFTATNDQSVTKIAFSEDGGKSFDNPIRFDLGNTIGRVAIELLDKETAFVVWIENNKLLGRTVNTNGNLGKPIWIGDLSQKRSSGFPQMKKLENELWFAWTDDYENFKQIKIAKVPYSDILIKK